MTVGRERRVTVCADVDDLNHVAARAVVDSARESITARGRFVLLLTGGETPRGMYQLLASRYVAQIAWDKVKVFFSDERCVPPDDERNNYRMVRETLLSRVPTRPEDVFAIPTEGATPPELASRYEATLRAQLGSAASAPTFDFALLGMGGDGHTASLFPGDPAVRESAQWAVAVQAPAGIAVRDRITLTLPVLNQARRVVFLVAGEGKRDAVARVLGPEADQGEEPLPPALVHGLNGAEWLLDAAAAGVSSRRS